MRVVNTVLKWANAVGLTAEYPQRRRMLFGGVHAGYYASLAQYASPMDQLFGDVQTLYRQGPLADGVAPFRPWLQNVRDWAERSGKPIDGLSAVLESVGLSLPAPASSPAPVAAQPAAAVLQASVFFLAANVDRDRLLSIDKEINEVQTLADGAVHRDRFALHAWPDLKLTQIAPQLIRKAPRVLHFSGHGASNGALLMLGDDGQTRRVMPAPLATLISVTGESLRLVVLNACYSEALANAIVDALDVAVVGMTRMVQDATALLYSRTLYESLFNGLTIEKAHRVAAATLVGMGQVDADAPALMARADSDVTQRLLWD